MGPKTKTAAIHLGLFLATLVTTTLAGGEWTFGKYVTSTSYTLDDFLAGLGFSLPFLAFLTTHEFGHYFTARWHKVKTSLPYFIPLWLPIMPTIGTVGAVIRIKERISSRRVNFDIGIAGPLAGFVVSLGVLFYGFTHLPEQEYLFQIHPEYEQYGSEYAEHVYEAEHLMAQDSILIQQLLIQDSLRHVASDTTSREAWVPPELNQEGAQYPLLYVGSNLIFRLFETYVVSDKSQIPSRYEIYHYPWLFAGFLALFFTALNLTPIGQLDGGHILYGLVGPKWHRIVASIALVLMVFYAGLGLINPHELDGDTWAPLKIGGYIWFLLIVFSRMKLSTQMRIILALSIFVIQFGWAFLNPDILGYPGWLVFAFLVGRVLGVDHPVPINDQPLDLKRKILGWMALIIFILCFSPEPLGAIVIEGP